MSDKQQSQKTGNVRSGNSHTRTHTHTHTHARARARNTHVVEKSFKGTNSETKQIHVALIRGKIKFMLFIIN